MGNINRVFFWNKVIMYTSIAGFIHLIISIILRKYAVEYIHSKEYASVQLIIDCTGISIIIISLIMRIYLKKKINSNHDKANLAAYRKGLLDRKRANEQL